MVRTLSVYRLITRTRRQVFSGDDEALEFTLIQLQSQFHKFANETDPAKLAALWQQGQEVAHFLKHNVRQGVMEDQAHLRVTPHTGGQVHAEWTPVHELNKQGELESEVPKEMTEMKEISFEELRSRQQS